MATTWLGNSNSPTRWVFGIMGTVILILILYWNLGTLVLVSISFFLAYVLNPIIQRLEHHVSSRNSAAIILFLLFFGLLTLFLLYLVPQINSQIRQTAVKIQESWSAVEPAKAPLNPPISPPAADESVSGDWLSNQLNAWLKRLHISMDEQNIDQYLTQFWAWVRTNFPSLLSPIWEAFQQMFAGISNFIVGIMNILLVPVFTFYFLRDFDKLRDHFYQSMPLPWRPIAADWLGELDKVVGGFLRGQFTIAIILAMLYAIGLSLLGIPLGAILGIISGLANLVPYMSLVVGLAPALFLSFLDKPEFWRLLWVILLFSGGQLLEGYYLSPRIMGRRTGLHPVIIMVSIIVGGTLLGLTGIVMAVPMAGMMKIAISRWHSYWKKNYWNSRGGQYEEI